MDLATIISDFGTQGIFCGLFIYTYLSNQKSNTERETKYIETIKSFRESIDELKDVINNINNKMGDEK